MQYQCCPKQRLRQPRRESKPVIDLSIVSVPERLNFSLFRN
jgi:hypothetical protein